MLDVPIPVTQPSLPPLDEFVDSLRDIWQRKWLTNNGEYHKRFEAALAEYLGVQHVSLFCNGMIALQVGLQALEVTGEVITTPFSFPATTHAIHWNHCTPVFADIEPGTCNLDPARIEALITPRTTCLLPVHVYGNPCDVRGLQEVADRHGLKVFYDAAHAFGVRLSADPASLGLRRDKAGSGEQDKFRMLNGNQAPRTKHEAQSTKHEAPRTKDGENAQRSTLNAQRSTQNPEPGTRNPEPTSILNFGDLSMLSFHATKVFNTIEGGALITNDAALKKRIDFLKNFGFANETTVIEPGTNGKMNEVQAAYGLLQLKYVDGEIAKRREVAETYRRELAGIPGLRLLHDLPQVVHNYSYFPVFVDEAAFGLSRDALYERLKAHGIFGRRYFYPLISSFPMYEHLPSAAPGNLPVANAIANQVLCLPIYAELGAESARRIAETVAQA